MAKPELGTKRSCPSCGKKYYDLNRDPIICPSCGTVFEVVKVSPVKPAAKKPPEPAPKAEVEATVAAEETTELVSLEEADEEATETGVIALEADDDDTVENEEDNTFLVADDEEGEDVTVIIGAVSDEEER